jgi:hypothetical protein
MLATSQALTGVGYVDLVIIIGKVAGALLSIFGLVYTIVRFKPIRRVWVRNILEPLSARRERVVGEVVERHIEPLRADIAADRAQTQANTEQVGRLVAIVERELNPDSGSSMVDKVDRLVRLHEDNPEHTHKAVPR